MFFKFLCCLSVVIRDSKILFRIKIHGEKKTFEDSKCLEINHRESVQITTLKNQDFIPLCVEKCQNHEIYLVVAQKKYHRCVMRESAMYSRLGFKTRQGRYACGGTVPKQAEKHAKKGVKGCMKMIILFEAVIFWTHWLWRFSFYL